jgi:hypothetical protein
MIIEILFVVVMLLWFLSVLPYPPLAAYSAAGNFLAWFAVLLLGLFLFLPALRG